MDRPKNKGVRPYNIVPPEEDGRMPPQAIDFEEILLGALMIDKSIIPKVISILKQEAFYKESHSLVFKAIKDLSNNGNPVDIMTVTEQLRRNGDLDAVGGPYFVAQLTNKVVSGANSNFHARIIYERYMKREWIGMGSEVIRRGYDDTEDVFEIGTFVLDSSKRIIGEVNKMKKLRQKDVIKTSINNLDLMLAGKTKSYLSTGMKQFDSIANLNTGIVMIAGAGGIGKTTFTTFLVKQICELNSEVSILWYVIDHETGLSINRKFMSADLFLTDKQLRGIDYRLSDIQRQAIIALSSKYAEWDIEFVETPCSIMDVDNHWATFCEEKKGRKPILVIDNIMRILEMKSSKHTIAVDDSVANTIADMYKNHKDQEPLVIFLHHMTKDQVSKFNLDQAYRPTIENVKGSGRYSDITEMVILLNRPGAYDMLLNEFPNARHVLKDMFYADIVKNTFGNLGLIRFFVNPDFGVYQEIK